MYFVALAPHWPQLVDVQPSAAVGGLTPPVAAVQIRAVHGHLHSVWVDEPGGQHGLPVALLHRHHCLHARVHLRVHQAGRPRRPLVLPRQWPFSHPALPAPATPGENSARRHCSGDHPPLLPPVPQLPLVLGMPRVEQGSPVHQEGRPPQVPAHHSLMAVIPRTHPSQVACFRGPGRRSEPSDQMI